MTPDGKSAQSLAPLGPGATIGILGGGQLARMLTMAAHRLGLKTHIFCPDTESPAFEVTPHHTRAAYSDADALDRFARSVERVTYEFENIPVGAIAILEQHCPVMPGAKALAICQDRLAEKRFLSGLGLVVAPFLPVETMVDLNQARQRLAAPAILKTRRLGYDGKGQQHIGTDTESGAAIAALAGAGAVLEEFVDFDAEISIILARGTNGEMASYDPARNTHENHILATSTVPAGLPAHVSKMATRIAEKIATAFEYVGVLGVEFFLCGETLIVNEIAPRVHNSGHWTEAACAASQFEQHIRAVAGWPLADPVRHADAVMQNLIGDQVRAVAAGESVPGCKIHLYGKNEIRPGRKMGHLTRLTARAR
ncbi:MAG: 5-(carboxyamino)imidazole ribonucleotide synthase [Alphaproteobacteria bacterium]|nr:5-(carboxyamino)imidazole ribonucleotide synthase [Alphaproteobacteria bacterium]